MPARIARLGRACLSSVKAIMASVMCFLRRHGCARQNSRRCFRVELCSSKTPRPPVGAWRPAIWAPSADEASATALSVFRGGNSTDVHCFSTVAGAVVVAAVRQWQTFDIGRDTMHSWKSTGLWDGW